MGGRANLAQVAQPPLATEEHALAANARAAEAVSASAATHHEAFCQSTDRVANR